MWVGILSLSHRIQVGDGAARDDVSPDGRHVSDLLPGEPAEHLHDLDEHPRPVRLHPPDPLPARLLQAAQGDGGSKFDCIAALTDAVELGYPGIQTFHLHPRSDDHTKSFIFKLQAQNVLFHCKEEGG